MLPMTSVRPRNEQPGREASLLTCFSSTFLLDNSKLINARTASLDEEVGAQEENEDQSPRIPRLQTVSDPPRP